MILASLRYEIGAKNCRQYHMSTLFCSSLARKPSMSRKCIRTVQLPRWRRRSRHSSHLAYKEANTVRRSRDKRCQTNKAWWVIGRGTGTNNSELNSNLVPRPSRVRQMTLLNWQAGGARLGSAIQNLSLYLASRSNFPLSPASNFLFLANHATVNVFP